MDDAPPKDGPSRRAVIAAPCAAGMAALLAGCSTYGGASGGQPEPAPATTGGAPASPLGAAATGAGGASALARVSDIPVGGGKIFEDRQVVVTQPQAGTIKAFSSICTHQGCAVAKVDRTIDCPCHGSRFNIADGSVASGPAPRGLPSVAVKVSGDIITLG
jgi:nitrite reductase/ring-hydroxylating ferredoxin subunit